MEASNFSEHIHQKYVYLVNTITDYAVSKSYSREY
jgi:hypothetical protein